MYSKFIEEKAKELGLSLDTSDISVETNRIKLVDELNIIIRDFGVVSDLVIDIRNTSDSTYILYKYTDKSRSNCRGGIKVTTGVVADINNLLSKIALGENIIHVLNNKLSMIQAEKGLLLSVRFKFGLFDYCRVADWDYSSICIYTSVSMINSLIDNTTSDRLDEYISSLVSNTVWSDSISEYIRGFNSHRLNIKMQAKIQDISISRSLEDNMILVSGVRDIIRDNARSGGVQTVKSVKIVDTVLGLFAAIVIWNIDYKNREISVDILDDKVLDVKNDRFIVDHSLYYRIKQIVDEETDNITEEFKRMAS